MSKITYAKPVIEILSRYKWHDPLTKYSTSYFSILPYFQVRKQQSLWCNYGSWAFCLAWLFWSVRLTVAFRKVAYP